MSKPYICGDDSPIYTPGESCDCNYTMHRVDSDEYYAIYQLLLSDTPVGDTIYIPIDKYVTEGVIGLVVDDDEPYDGATVGDIYLDLTIHNQDAHVYVPFSDFIYSKEQIDSIISQITIGGMIILEEGEPLPEEGDPTATYLMPNGNDGYTKYVYVPDTGWLTLGETSFSDVTGKPTANLTPTFGDSVVVSQISQSSTGQISATDRNITLPSLSVTQITSSGTKIAEIDVDGTTTDLYAPSGGSGTVTDVEVDGVSVVDAQGVAQVDLTGKQDTLVSGTNIKTVNEETLLGSGNVQITKTLTQAQYDALTPAEQNNGVAYFIPDADPVPVEVAESAWCEIYKTNQAVNNTASKITGLTIAQGGNYDDYFNVGTADQITIKKTGVYRIDILFMFSAVTNASSVKRVSLYKNGTENNACMGRANSLEDFSYWSVSSFTAGDVLTMYGRSEDGNATLSLAKILITPMKQ